MDEETQLYYAGRVIAMELVLRGLMTAFADQNGLDEEGVRQWRSDTLSSLQHLERDVDPQSDEIWGYAVQSLESLFEQVAHRLAYMRRG